MIYSKSIIKDPSSKARPGQPPLYKDTKGKRLAVRNQSSPSPLGTMHLPTRHGDMSPIVIINHGLLLLSLPCLPLAWAPEPGGCVEVVAASESQQRASECMARSCCRLQGDKRPNTIHLNADGFPLNPHPFPSLPFPSLSFPSPSLLRERKKSKDFSTSNSLTPRPPPTSLPPTLSRVCGVMDVT